jgi:hypothetical protein
MPYSVEAQTGRALQIKGGAMEQERLKRLFVLVTMISGIAAAYLMYRRGASLGEIAKKTLTSPVGALASEIGNVLESSGSQTPAKANSSPVLSA